MTTTTTEQPTFLVADISGRGGSYHAQLSDLLQIQEDEDDEDCLLTEWADNAEVGQTFCEYNSIRITRIF